MKSCKEPNKPRKAAKARVVSAISWDDWHHNQNSAPTFPEGYYVSSHPSTVLSSKPPDLKKVAKKPKATKSPTRNNNNRRPLVSWNAWREAEVDLSNHLETATTLGKTTKGSCKQPFRNHQNNESIGPRHDYSNPSKMKARAVSPSSSHQALGRRQHKAQNLTVPRYRDLDDIGHSNSFDSDICDYSDIHLTEEIDIMSE